MGKKRKKHKGKYSYLAKTSSYCARCGKDLLNAKMYATKDHIVPKHFGGANSLENYMPLCSWCNTRKGHDIVYPAFYYYQLNYKAHLIKDANKLVVDYLMGLDRNYLKKFPMLFKEFLFSYKVRYTTRCITTVMGYAPGWTHAEFFDRVYPNDLSVRDFIYDNRYYIRNPQSLFVGRFESSKEITTLFDVTVHSRTVLINIYYVSHRRMLINGLSKFFQIFKDVYMNMGVTCVRITSNRNLWESLIISFDLRDYFVVNTIDNIITFDLRLMKTYNDEEDEDG